jgi:hypothetical protein
VRFFHATAVAVIVVALIVLYTALSRAHARWRLRQRWLRATAAEEHARQLLESLGYAVLGMQVETAYSLLVDQHPKIISLRADYVVSRGGLSYVAEVKSGKLAPSLDTSTTRRQLLEYLVAFRVHGVLLVDGETRRVHEVVFPRHVATGAVTLPALRLGWIVVGLAVAVALLWIRSP